MWSLNKILILICLTVAGLAIVNDAMACELSPTDCLARNIYFEARGESTFGMIAVGQVTLNRVKSKNWQSDICSVVYADRQFSWTQDEYSNIPENMDAYRWAWLVAGALLQKDSAIIDLTHNATHYYSGETSPEWASELQLTWQIGGHKFYK
jgi:spore germination cell wall hydrolase CwlJ-like protein